MQRKQSKEKKLTAHCTEPLQRIVTEQTELKAGQDVLSS
jgi:hypothetical protein